MNRWTLEIFWILLPIGLAVGQASLVNEIFPAHILQLILLGGVVAALLGGLWRGVQVTLVGGYLLDLSSALPFGVTITSLAAGLAAFLFFQIVVLKNLALHAYLVNATIAVSVSAAVFFGLTNIIHAAGLTQLHMNLQTTATMLAVQAVGQAVLLVLCIPVLRRFAKNPLTART